MYHINFGEREFERLLWAASRSLFGQELELDDATFELDYQLRLPLSLPGTPLELETDIVMGLEKLRGEGNLDIEISPVEQIQDVPLTHDLMPLSIVYIRQLSHLHSTLESVQVWSEVFELTPPGSTDNPQKGNSNSFSTSLSRQQLERGRLQKQRVLGNWNGQQGTLYIQNNMYTYTNYHLLVATNEKYLLVVPPMKLMSDAHRNQKSPSPLSITQLLLAQQQIAH